jgi:hypothetical protein
MTFPDISTLNDRFAVDGAVCFVEGNGAMTKLEMRFNDSSLELYLQGAHITCYQPSALVSMCCG